MRSKLLAVALMAAGLAPSAASAGVFTDDLTRCVVQSASVTDRAALMRWVFMAAATNPSMSDLVRADENTRERGRREAAATFNRLLLTDCRSQAVAAVRNEGASAIEAASQALGEVAGREMLSGPAAVAELQRVAQFLGNQGFEALGTEAGVVRGNPPAGAPRTR